MYADKFELPLTGVFAIVLNTNHPAFTIKVTSVVTLRLCNKLSHLLPLLPDDGAAPYGLRGLALATTKP
ncbi:MAG: hypothetical protein AMXMBFR82_03810 [Candidatus Hydrogenedentota bacterium]